MELDYRQLDYRYGPPRAAKGKFPYRGHRSMYQVMLEERDPGLMARIRLTAGEAVAAATEARRVEDEALARTARGIADRERRAAYRARMEGVCRVCKGRSVEWLTGLCTCGNTGLAHPPKPA